MSEKHLIDGYMAIKETSDPSSVSEYGLIYTKDDGGDTELFYLDDSGNVVQITQDGSVVGGGGSNTLDQAYDEGGAGAGRTINVTDGAVELIGDQSANILEVKALSGAENMEGYGIYVHTQTANNNLQAIVVDFETGSTFTNTKGIVVNASSAIGAFQSGQEVPALDIGITPDSGDIATWYGARFRALSAGGASTNMYGIALTGSGWDVALSAASGDIHLDSGALRLGEISDPTGVSNNGFLYAKEVSGISELFYLDSYGTATQITSDGYLDTFDSLRGVGIYKTDTDPDTVQDKAFIYAKDVSGVLELFYKDGSGNVVQMTEGGSVVGGGGSAGSSGVLLEPNYWNNYHSNYSLTSVSSDTTVGSQFYVDQSVSVNGVNFYWAQAGSFNIKCSLWRYNNLTSTPTLLASKTVSVTSVGSHEALFDDPITIPDDETGFDFTYFVGVYDTSGSYYTRYLGSGVSDTYQKIGRSLHYNNKPKYFASGDNRPTTASGTQSWSVDPIVEIMSGAPENLVDGYLILPNQSVDPEAAEDYGVTYVKSVDGYSELHYLDDYGNSTQITNKGSAVGGGGSVDAPMLWVPPRNPSSDDVEFDSDTLPAGWAETYTPSGIIDPYAAFSSGNPRRDINTFRSSCYCIQPPSDSSSGYFHRAYTFPTNVMIWSRLSHTRGSSGINDDARAALSITQTSLGNPDSTNLVWFYFNEADAGTEQIAITSAVGGSYVARGTWDDRDGTRGQVFTTLGIHKVGTMWHFWAFTDYGESVHLLEVNGLWGLSPDRLGFWFQNTSTTNYTKIFFLDYIRFRESATFLPGFGD